MFINTKEIEEDSQHTPCCALAVRGGKGQQHPDQFGVGARARYHTRNGLRAVHLVLGSFLERPSAPELGCGLGIRKGL